MRRLPNSQTTNAIKQANQHADQDETQAVKKANQYTNNKATITLHQAHSYTNAQAHSAVEQANHYSDQNAASTLSAANKYTDQRVNALRHDIDRVHDQANAGIASAMAMSAIPMRQGYHYTIGLGTAHYDNQCTVAIGGKFDVGKRCIVTLAASDDSENNTGVSAGVGFGF
ncbi:YadA C-terminal domain-containing protein [Photobacterium leiognathi subsp. mandapamensis]|uniref:YadA C-terminal domain-containing protein n=1 Tax=Photobacterium leiognathi TaxID=553611 RepID=UPI003AF3DAB8